MSKLKNAVEMSYMEWLKSIDEKIEKEMNGGRMPYKTKEQMSSEASVIWDKSQKKKEQD